MAKNEWTEEEIKMLEDCYCKFMSTKNICELFPNRTENAITVKASKLGFTKKYIKSNNSNFKGIYQDYNWCYENYIIKGMSHQEMADMCNATRRVIEKWCCERHRLNRNTRANIKKLTEEQKQIIIMGTLGDGHIDKRPTQHMYIESHAENEKDYLFWKYNKLKKLCNKEPIYIKGVTKNIRGKMYQCQPQYKMITHILNCLTEIFEMTKIDKINKMTIFGLCLYLLDDGYRNDSNWTICVANLNNEEKQVFIKKCESFNLNCWILKDIRYVNFDSISSRKIDKEIMNIFGDIDITRKKILNKVRSVEYD